MEALRQYASQHKKLHELCEISAWGVDAMLELPSLTRLDELDATEHPDEGNASEVSSESSSSAASGSDISVQASADVDWVLPEKSCQSRESRLHLVMDYVDDKPLAACRESNQRPFQGTGHTGSGIPNAGATGRQWCPRCW
eukprot:945812-Karenia_brevis.AAC.1